MNELTIGARRRGVLVAGVVAAGLLTLSTAGASAAIVCRGDFCWRVHTAYAYPASPTIVTHVLTIGGRRLRRSLFASTGVRSSASPESTSFGSMVASTIQNGK